MEEYERRYKIEQIKLYQEEMKSQEKSSKLNLVSAVLFTGAALGMVIGANEVNGVLPDVLAIIGGTVNLAAAGSQFKSMAESICKKTKFEAYIDQIKENLLYDKEENLQTGGMQR